MNTSSSSRIFVDGDIWVNGGANPSGPVCAGHAAATPATVSNAALCLGAESGTGAIGGTGTFANPTTTTRWRPLPNPTGQTIPPPQRESDPFAGENVAHASCSGNYDSSLGNTNRTLNPENLPEIGFNRITATGGTLHLNPGVYTITGDFSVSGGATVTGTGVTLYFCSAAFYSIATTNSRVTLSATGGPGSPFVFFFDRGNTTNNAIRLANDRTETHLTGVVYAPTTGFDQSGGTAKEFAVVGAMVINNILGSGDVYWRVFAGEVEPPTEGDLLLRKAVQGPLAGSQGPIVITANCGTAGIRRLEIEAGFGTANQATSDERRFALPHGTSCTVTETEKGAHGTVGVETTRTGAEPAIIRGGETTTVHFTDTYSRTAPPGEGFLQVVKRIGGTGAGLQGKVVIKVECGENFSTEFVVLAHAAAGSHESPEYGPFENGTSCTVQETDENGANDAVSVHTVGSPTRVKIGEANGRTRAHPRSALPSCAPPSRGGNVCLLSTTGTTFSTTGGSARYRIEGNLVINGPQSCSGSPSITVGGAVGIVPPITGSCGFPSPQSLATPQPDPYASFPFRGECVGGTVLDSTPNTLNPGVYGTIATSGRVITLNPGIYTIRGGITGNGRITGTGVALYFCDSAGIRMTGGALTLSAPGGSEPFALFFNRANTGKVIDTSGGPVFHITGVVYAAAGHVHGHPIKLTVVGDLVIGRLQLTSNSGFDTKEGLAPPPAGVTKVEISDVYTQIAHPGEGFLRIEKTIEGTGAGLQGEVVIEVTCGDSPTEKFVLPAHADRGPHLSEPFGPFPEGTQCTVDEVENGHTEFLDAPVITGVPVEGVEINAGETTKVEITDTYTRIIGSLIIRKTIEGAAAGEQGAIRIEVTCGDEKLPVFELDPHTLAGTYSSDPHPVPAGETCKVSELTNGGSDTLDVETSGDQPTVVPANGVGEIHLTNDYTVRTPGSGSLVVKKTIQGAAAAYHGLIRIEVTCGEKRLTPDFVIEAGTGLGTHDSEPYTNIPLGTSCSVTENPNGSTNTVHVQISGARTTIIDPETHEGVIHLTNTYTHAAGPPTHGILVVKKTINGPAAAKHGDIKLNVECDGVGLDPFVIPAGTGVGTHESEEYRNIPTPATCTVTEVENGGSSSIHVEVTGKKSTTILGNGIGTIHLTDHYTAVGPGFGSLVVSKTIAGPAAGQQGPVTIQVTCGGTRRPDFTIAAGAPSGTTSRRYDNIPAGSTCTVVETVDGRTSTVAVAVTGSGASTTIAAGGIANLTVTDTYSSHPGSLVVNKTITGPAAGQQGPVTIQVTCDGMQLPDFTIAAGSGAGTTSQTYSGLPAGAVCTVTETQDGHTSTVSVTVSGDHHVTIPGGGAATATLVDTYTGVPGSLEVKKTIAGGGAGSQWQVRISVTCGGVRLPDFVIPAGTAAGTTSRTYTGLTAGTVCTVTETLDGHTSSVDVAVTSTGRTVTIAAGGTATAAFTDRYTRLPGRLTVQKTIAGLGAGTQGTIRIQVTCNGRRLPDFVIPPQSGPSTVSRTYHGLVAGAACTVTETASHGSRRVTVPANGTATVQLTDRFLAVARGALEVRKTASASRIVGGKTVDFTITATNRGAVTLTNVRVCDRLPGQLVFLSTGGARLVDGSACWTIDRLSPGASRSFTVRTQSYRTTVSRRVCNLATAQAANGARGSATACVVIRPSAGHGGGVTG